MVRAESATKVDMSREVGVVTGLWKPCRRAERQEYHSVYLLVVGVDGSRDVAVRGSRGA